jgi:hypothetical protein
MWGGFVSAEYVGHFFDYGVSVFIRVAYPGRSLHFVVYETDPPQFGCSNIYV